MWPGMFQQEKKTPETINQEQVFSGLMTERQVFEEFHLTREDLLQAWAKTGEITPIIVGDEVQYIRTQLEEQAVALDAVPLRSSTRIRH
jgi:hypothetical protein